MYVKHTIDDVEFTLDETKDMDGKKELHLFFQTNGFRFNMSGTLLFKDHAELDQFKNVIALIDTGEGTVVLKEQGIKFEAKKNKLFMIEDNSGFEFRLCIEMDDADAVSGFRDLIKLMRFPSDVK